jgi:hypothetical protein
MIVSKYLDAGAAYEWEFYIDGGLLYFDVNNTVDYIGKATTAAVSGGWQHVVATYDGSETRAGIKLYIDGVEQATSNQGCRTGDIEPGPRELRWHVQHRVRG